MPFKSKSFFHCFFSFGLLLLLGTGIHIESRQMVSQTSINKFLEVIQNTLIELNNVLVINGTFRRTKIAQWESPNSYVITTALGSCMGPQKMESFARRGQRTCAKADCFKKDTVTVKDARMKFQKI